MKKKHIIILSSVALVAALAVVLAILFIHGRLQEREDEEFMPTANQYDISKLKDAKIQIYFESASTPVMADVLNAVNEKLRRELKTELEFKTVYENPEGYIGKIRQDIASGIKIDAFYYSSYFPASLKSLAEEGLAADITRDFPLYASDYFSSFTREEISAMSTNGKLYAIPYRIPAAARKCAVVRDDLMEKYGIPEIKNYEDYEVYLDAVKKNEPNLIPMNYYESSIGLFAETNGYVVLDYTLGLVYKLEDSAMKLSAWEQTPEFESGLKRIKSWYDKEYLTKNVGISQIDFNMITGGKWASFITDWGNEFEYNAMLANEEKNDFRYVAYPLQDGYSARNSPLDSGLVINAKSEQADRVLMFVNWLQSDQENYDSLMYGIEGKHYVKKADYIVPAERTGLQDSFFQWGWKAPFRNIAYERANFPGLKEKVERYNRLIREKTKFPPHMGFVPDYSALDDITNMRRFQFSSLDQQIYTGIFSEADIAEYIKEQKDNGVQKLVEEVQKQLDIFSGK